MEQADMPGFKIGIYVRESRDDNEENYETIETQRDLLVDFVGKNRLGSICSIYVDDNVSGSAFEREGLGKLKADVMNGRVDLLLVKDLSRLGRNNAKTLLFLDFLEENGVRIITFDGRYDSLRDNDTVGIETWFNERYIRDISRKIRASLKFKIEKGEYLGHAPYGYKKSPVEGNRLFVEEDTAGVVRLVFRLYRMGYGYYSIARQLNGKGYAAPGGGKLWSPVAVRRVLCNRVYSGDTVQGVSEKVSFKSKKTRRLPEERWVVTTDTHEAIISRDEFEEVQKIREGKKCLTSPHKQSLHLLKGVIYCGRCGCFMYARIRKERQTAYVCSNYYKKGKNACSSHFVYESTIVKCITDELTSLLKNREVIEKLVFLVTAGNLLVNGGEEKLKRVEQQLLSRQKQQEILYMDRLEGRITEQLFMRMNRTFEERVSVLKTEAARLAGRDRHKPGLDLLLNEIAGRLEKDFITNEMIRCIVKKVTVYDPEDPAPDGADGSGLIVVDFKMNKV